MLKLMSFLLVLTFSAKSFSQSCIGNLLMDKKTSYVDRLDESGRTLVGFGATAGGLVVGMAIASSALPVFLIAAGFASSVVLAGDGIAEIHNKPIKRMIKLIMQARALEKDPSSEPGKLLKRLHKRIQREHGEISIEELAHGIVVADENQDCGSIRRVKEIQKNISSGRLPMVQL